MKITTFFVLCVFIFNTLLLDTGWAGKDTGLVRVRTVENARASAAVDDAFDTNKKKDEASPLYAQAISAPTGAFPGLDYGTSRASPVEDSEDKAFIRESEVLAKYDISLEVIAMAEEHPDEIVEWTESEHSTNFKSSLLDIVGFLWRRAEADARGNQEDIRILREWRNRSIASVYCSLISDPETERRGLILGLRDNIWIDIFTNRLKQLEPSMELLGDVLGTYIVIHNGRLYARGEESQDRKFKPVDFIIYVKHNAPLIRILDDFAFNAVDREHRNDFIKALAGLRKFGFEPYEEERGDIAVLNQQAEYIRTWLNEEFGRASPAADEIFEFTEQQNLKVWLEENLTDQDLLSYIPVFQYLDPGDRGVDYIGDISVVTKRQIEGRIHYFVLFSEVPSLEPIGQEGTQRVYYATTIKNAKSILQHGKYQIPWRISFTDSPLQLRGHISIPFKLPKELLIKDKELRQDDSSSYAMALSKDLIGESLPEELRQSIGPFPENPGPYALFENKKLVLIAAEDAGLLMRITLIDVEEMKRIIQKYQEENEGLEATSDAHELQVLLEDNFSPSSLTKGYLPETAQDTKSGRASPVAIREIGDEIKQMRITLPEA